MRESPGALPHLFAGLHRYVSSAVEIVIVGGDDGEVVAHLAAVRSVFLPNAVVALKGSEAIGELEELVPLVQGKSSVEGKATTYLCVGQTCLAPITDSIELERALREIHQERKPESSLEWR